MKGRGDDATLTERQVKRLSARQVCCWLRCCGGWRGGWCGVRVADADA